MRFERPVQTEKELLYTIQSATLRSSQWVTSNRRKTLFLEWDQKKTERLAARKCKPCFYLKSGIAGQAITVTTCIGCGAEMQFSSTATNKFCKTCSEKFDICCECGSDMEMQRRMKLQKAKKKR